jgi:hypothetical protein
MAELTAEERRLTQRVAAPNKLGLPNALDQLRAGRREDVRALLDAQPMNYRPQSSWLGAVS